MRNKFFKYKGGKLQLPVFFPDATRGVLKSLDSLDIKNTQTPGVLVNTYHLWHGLPQKILNEFGGIRQFMNWQGAVISDSGGFQVMSVIKKGVTKGKIKDEGIVMYPGKNRRLVFSPEDSIRFQMSLETDMVVVLDDFTDPDGDRSDATESVERTVMWAERSKKEFEKICKKKGLSKEERPYLLGVVQGGEFADVRKDCAVRLGRIGFDGFGWGGWPINKEGNLDLESAKIISENAPEDYLLYGLGVGKPEDIVESVKLGFGIFDCVLPTRDGRHGRLYVFDAPDISQINLQNSDFYHFYDAKKEKHLTDKSPVSTACDCLLCTNYSRGYLSHLFKIGDVTAMRLASIHNLRFYSILMEKLKDSSPF